MSGLKKPPGQDFSDEELARILQMEEQRMSSASRNDSRYGSAQERGDAELARRVANMDLKSPPSQRLPNATASPRNLKPPPDSSLHRRGASVDSLEYADFGTASAFYDDKGNRRPSSEAAAETHRVEGRERFYKPHNKRGGRKPARETRSFHHRSINIDMEEDGRGVQRSSSANSELAYALQLQEQAFSNFRKGPEQPTSNEESDLRLALRMQEEMRAQSSARVRNDDEESVGSDEPRNSPWKQYSKTPPRPTPPGKNQNKDHALAEFMSLTGASFSDLSVDLINDIVGNNSSGSARTDKRGVCVAPPQSAEQTQDPTRLRQVLAQGGTERPNLPSRGTQLNSTPLQQLPLQQLPLQPGVTAGTRNGVPQSIPPLGEPPAAIPPAPIPPPGHIPGGQLPSTRGAVHVPHARESITVPSSHRRSHTGGVPAPLPSLQNDETSATVSSSHRRSHTGIPAPLPSLQNDGMSAIEDTVSPSRKSKKKKKRSFFGFGRSNELSSDQSAQIPTDIPLPPPIPPAELGPTAPVPPVSPMKGTRQQANFAMTHPRTPTQGAQPSMRDAPVSPLSPSAPNIVSRGDAVPPISPRLPLAPDLPRGGPPQRSICVVCCKTTGSFLSALDQKFHPECFRCAACRQLIDPRGQFKSKENNRGTKEPYHITCHAEMFGIKCSVCRNSMPISSDGTVAYVKHPFFDKEFMCMKHVDERVRICSGCKRFEPRNKPFVDLGDRNRCVCPACFKSVVINDADVVPLWKQVIRFLEHGLKLPIWDALRNMPVLLISSETLHEQLSCCQHPHEGAKQLMCSGMCLTDQEIGGGFALMPSLRYDNSSNSFRSLGRQGSGFFEAPAGIQSESSANVFAISSMYGLPRDLTAGILAHEAIHAWFLLHPKRNPKIPLPVAVEEGCAQLAAMLFLNDGLGPPARPVDDADGPSDERIRQYLKFGIERDTTDMYGVSYREAAKLYRDIGMAALLGHVLHYGGFPRP